MKTFIKGFLIGLISITLCTPVTAQRGCKDSAGYHLSTSQLQALWLGQFVPDSCTVWNTFNSFYNKSTDTILTDSAVTYGHFPIASINSFVNSIMVQVNKHSFRIDNDEGGHTTLDFHNVTGSVNNQFPNKTGNQVFAFLSDMISGLTTNVIPIATSASTIGNSTIAYNSSFAAYVYPALTKAVSLTGDSGTYLATSEGDDLDTPQLELAVHGHAGLIKLRENGSNEFYSQGYLSLFSSPKFLLYFGGVDNRVQLGLNAGSDVIASFSGQNGTIVTELTGTAPMGTHVITIGATIPSYGNGTDTVLAKPVRWLHITLEDGTVGRIPFYQ